MEIFWSRAAREDIGRAIDYLGQRNPAAAEEVEERILAAVEKLANVPHLGRPGRVAGTRELVITRLPYIVIYLVTTRRITILRVRHTAQAWPPQPDQDAAD